MMSSGGVEARASADAHGERHDTLAHRGSEMCCQEAMQGGIERDRATKVDELFLSGITAGFSF